jgi:hypothetical protein
MKTNDNRASWIAFGLFYAVLIIIVSVLDAVNQVLRLTYWGAQVGLITLGVGLFALMGRHISDSSATHGVLLAFTIGILTIIPAVLMGLGQIPGLWPQYFYIAFGMAAGSLLTFAFIKLSKKIPGKDRSGSKGHHVD